MRLLDWDNVVSVSIGMACAFLILGMAGCTPAGQQAVREAIQTKQHCDEGDVIIIVSGREQ